MTASDDEAGFLRRWSRRKSAATRPPPPPVESPPPELPAIESLGAASDYTVFLQQGVPAEVQRLALRRAWESDASIAGFRGMAEYAWDFNAPNYGSLAAVDNVARLVAEVLSPPVEVAAEPEPQSVAEQAAAPAEPPGLESEPEPAPQARDSLVSPKRRHGSALPA